MTLIYILIGISIISLICTIIAIMNSKGLDREINNLTNAYQNLNKQMEDMKQQDQAIVQTVQNSLKTFGDMISQNQRDGAANTDKRLADLNTRFSAMAVENEQKLENIRNTMEKKISDLTTDNNKQLEQMRQTVDEKLQKTLEDRISQSFKLVSERLEQVYKGLGEMQNLAVGVGDLKKVLSNVKTRGILGEVQLGAILEQILSPEQYEENVKTKGTGSERVEFAVKLPGDDDGVVWLPIDAKFPGDAYAKLMDAYDSGDTALIEEAAKNLERVIKSEAKDIRDKYIDPPHTTDFGIMFLPFEGLYAEVVRRGMVEALQREYKVNIAGPTTMAALLNSLQMGFRTLAVQKHSSEVWNILGAVKTEFEKFENVLTAAQKKMNQANEELDKLIGVRTRSIKRKLKTVTALPENASSDMLELTGFGDFDAVDEE
jgi:DNA recombination protein RmuC